MKTKTFDKLLYGLIIIMIAMMIMSIQTANATTKKPKPRPPISIEQSQTQKQNQEMKQRQTAIGNGGNSESWANGGSGGDASSAIQITGDEFYALSLMFPQAAGCFSGVQGGDKGSFLGIHLLNKSCWLNKVASEEPDIEINARLKCGDRKYRNAVAYDVPKRERQAACVRMKVDSGKRLMTQYTDKILALEARNNELNDLRAIDRREYDEVRQARDKCAADLENVEQECTK